MPKRRNKKNITLCPGTYYGDFSITIPKAQARVLKKGSEVPIFVTTADVKDKEHIVQYNFGSGQVDETYGDNVHIKLDRRIRRNYTVHVGVPKDNVRLVTLPRNDKKRLRNVIEEVLGRKHNE